MSTRETSAGAHSQSLAPHTRADTQPDLKFLTPYEIVSAPFEFAKVREALLNVLTVIGIALFISCAAASIPMFIFMLLFCRF